MASLTKILASLPMLIKAEEENKIALSSTVRKILPKFKKSNKDTLTVREILSHYGQLKAWIPFYKLTQDSLTQKNLKNFYSSKKSNNFTIKVAEDLYLNSSFKDSIFKQIRDAEQREKPGYKYSDLGYYIFKEALEKKYKKELASKSLAPGFDTFEAYQKAKGIAEGLDKASDICLEMEKRYIQGDDTDD